MPVAPTRPLDACQKDKKINEIILIDKKKYKYDTFLNDALDGLTRLSIAN